MDVGQRVRITRLLDKGEEGKVIATYTKTVPVKTLQVGDDKPRDYCKVALDDGRHVKLYPLDWVEAI